MHLINEKFPHVQAGLSTEIPSNATESKRDTSPQGNNPSVSAPSSSSNSPSLATTMQVKAAVDRVPSLANKAAVLMDTKSNKPWHGILNLINLATNTNYFYVMQLLLCADPHQPARIVLLRGWGRVGESGQTTLTDFADLSAAAAEFRRIFEEKTGNEWGASPFVAKPGKYLVQELGPTPAPAPFSASMAPSPSPAAQPSASVVKFENALDFLDKVKSRYAHTPAKYSEFLEIMKDFKKQTLGTADVVKRVTELFADQRDLIDGFQVFLPPSFKMNPSSSLVPDPQPKQKTEPAKTNSFHDAKSFIREVKSRFASTPQVYQDFLATLRDYQSRKLSMPQIVKQVEKLFAGHDALIRGFDVFLPFGEDENEEDENLEDEADEEEHRGRLTAKMEAAQPQPSAQFLPAVQPAFVIPSDSSQPLPSSSSGNRTQAGSLFAFLPSQNASAPQPPSPFNFSSLQSTLPSNASPPHADESGEDSDGNNMEDEEHIPGAPVAPAAAAPKKNRTRINIEYIKNVHSRKVTFSKRKAGLMKKAYELSMLSNCQVLVLIASEDGQISTFATPKLQPVITESQSKEFIMRCIGAHPNALAPSIPFSFAPPPSNGPSVLPVFAFNASQGEPAAVANNHSVLSLPSLPALAQPFAPSATSPSLLPAGAWPSSVSWSSTLPPGSPLLFPASAVPSSSSQPSVITLPPTDGAQDWLVGYAPRTLPAVKIALKHSIEHSSVVCCVRFSPDGKYFATGSNHTSQIFDIETGQKVHAFAVGNTETYLYVRSVCITPGNNLLLAGCEDKVIRVWDLHTQQQLKTLEGHALDIYAIDLHPSTGILASGSGDRTTKLWSIEQAVCLRTLGSDEGGPKDGVTSVAFSPDGRSLAIGSLDRIVRVFDVETGQCLKRLAGHLDSVYSVAFSPDGKTLATGSLDKTVRLWDIGSGSTRATLSGHEDFVLSAVFTPDGNWILSGSKDRTVLLWDSRSTSTHLLLQGHRNSVISVTANANGSSIATASGDCRARLWSFDTTK